MIHAQGSQSASICSKEIKKKQPDKKRVQKYCIQAGKYYQNKKKDAPASWYYLLGGSNNKNINEIQKHMTKSNTYRNIGNSYVLKGKYNQAKKLYTQYLKRASIRNADHYIHYNYKILNKLYPKKKKNLKKGLAVWDKIYKPLSSVNTLYVHFKKVEKAKKYKEAIGYLIQIITLQKKYQDKNNISIRDNLYHLGVIYSYNKQYKKSLNTLLEVIDLHQTNAYNDKDYSDLLVWIANDYEKLQQYKKAIKYRERSLSIKIKLSRKEDASMAKRYNYIGALYYKTGEYQEALTYYKKALTITEKVFGTEHTSTAAGYNNLGLIYKDMGNYPKALKYYQKSLSIQEKTLGKEHINTASGYNNLGMLYKKMGKYPKALEYIKKSLIIKEKLHGEEHLSTATSYTNLGGLYKTMGNYPKALKYHQKALLVNKKVSGEEHTRTAICYGNLGMLYDTMGDYSKALEYVQKALTIIEKILGEKHPTTVTSYSNLGFVYYHMGNYPKALEYHQKTSMITEEILGKKHPETAASYNNLAFLYYTMGDYPKALKYYQKTLFIKERILGKKHTATAISYNNLGGLYQKTGEYSKALKYYQKALSIREGLLGKKHIYTAESYSNLCTLYTSMKNYSSAYRYAKLSFNIFLKNRDQIFTILGSKQKEKYLKSTSRYITLLLDTSINYLTQLTKEKKTQESREILQSGANAWLNYKGSIFDSENSIAMLYSSTKDKKIKVKIDDLLKFKRDLAKLYQSLPKLKEKKKWQEKIKKTEKKISRLTNEIASKTTTFKEEQGLKSITYKEITSHLKKDELYVDYAKVGGYYYLFSLEKKNKITFTRISSKNTSTIDDLIKTFREDVTTILNNTNLTDEKLKSLTQSSKDKLSKLYTLVIQKPLGDSVQDKTNLIISPDGALRLLPFEALYNKANSKYLIEQKKIRYIPSGKELLRLYKYSKEKESKKKNAVIFANPNFNSKIASVSKEQIAITPNTSRSGIIKSLFRMRFSPLPGTKAEAKAIKATLSKKSILEYQENKATESTLMKIKEPNILHIATHGFFINDDTIPNPMLKSGIALAGANASAIKGKGDGIVTALKLSGLDLKGTDLVVLSACQTGVVDINSTDSVSGLSKAFIQAGAKDIVMSLWSVDDQATKELMTSFYQEMKENKNYAEALKAAKLKMIDEGRHPFYWAAFVVSGL